MHVAPKGTAVLMTIVVGFLCQIAKAQSRPSEEQVATRLSELHDWLDSIDVLPSEEPQLISRRDFELFGGASDFRDSIGIITSQQDNSLAYFSLTFFRGEVSLPLPEIHSQAPGSTKIILDLEFKDAVQILQDKVEKRSKQIRNTRELEYELACEWLALTLILRHSDELELLSQMQQLVITHPSILWRPLSKLHMEAFIGQRLMRQIHIDLSNESISWAELHHRTTEFVDKFPRSRLRSHAKTLAQKLSEMNRFDLKIKLLELPTSQDEEIDALILKLQNQTGQLMSSFQQFSAPFDSDALQSKVDSADASLTPAEQLVKIGFPAVPKLIAALNDDRFTRCSTSLTSNGFFRVETVGECIVFILDEIAVGHSFTNHLQLTSMFEQGLTVEGEERVLEWWDQVQQTNELDYLSRTLSKASEWDYFEVAKRLVNKYPDQAVSLLEKRFWSHPSYIDAAIVELIKPSLKGGEEFLRKARASTSLSIKVEAAKSLSAIDPEGSLSALMQTWEDLAEDPNAIEAARKELDPNGVVSLIAFLIRCDNVKAIQLLDHTYGKVDPETAYTIVANLSDVYGKTPNEYWEGRQPSSLETRKAATQLYLKALDDQRRRRVVESVSSNGKVNWNPGERLCEIAALHLSYALPDDLCPRIPKQEDREGAQGERKEIMDSFVLDVKLATQEWRDERNLTSEH